MMVGGGGGLCFEKVGWVSLRKTFGKIQSESWFVILRMGFELPGPTLEFLDPRKRPGNKS